MFCLERATYQERKATVGRGTKPITLKPGQFISGRKQISKVTGVPPSSVRNVLETLILDRQLDIEKTAQGSVFTILNWNKYQQLDSDLDNQWTTSGQPVDTKQEVKNVKKVKEYTKPFGLFWEAYPRKQNKRGAFKVWEKMNGDMPPIEEVIEIIEKQKGWPQFQQYTPHATTWLNNHRWEDEEHIAKSKYAWMEEME